LLPTWAATICAVNAKRSFEEFVSDITRIPLDGLFVFGAADARFT
jgi:hypothetical protein